MRGRITKILTAAALIVLTAGAAMAEPILKSGDRMVFLGDSITDLRIYTRYVMNYFALHHPGEEITFRNAGWGGDTAPRGLARLQRDVLSLKPTVVSICLGMNDAEYKAFDQPTYDNYIKNMKSIISELKKAGVKVVLLTPGCVDEDGGERFKGYNNTLERFANGIKELAVKENLPVYDIHSLMLEFQTKAKKDDPHFTTIPDGVHPYGPGQMLMAYGLIKVLGGGDETSALKIDAEKQLSWRKTCEVTNLKIAENAITFTRTDNALPAFLDQDAELTQKYVPIQSELDDYHFSVTGLKAGNWKLTVQGQEVGTFSADALANGVNLAQYPGPWKKLADEINDMSYQQEHLYFIRWRELSLLELPKEAHPELQDALRRMDKLITKEEALRIKKADSSRTWNWSLTLVQ